MIGLASGIQDPEPGIRHEDERAKPLTRFMNETDAAVVPNPPVFYPRVGTRRTSIH